MQTARQTSLSRTSIVKFLENIWRGSYLHNMDFKFWVSTDISSFQIVAIDVNWHNSLHNIDLKWKGSSNISLF